MAQLQRPVQVELSNGIPVIFQHSDAPVAASYWWVKTGSADEGKGEEGFAHFLEHMLFKDAAAKETGRASTGQMARQIESLGGDINAYTSFDQTVYHVTCAAHHWEKVLGAFTPMGRPQRFLKSDFEREREVILEELRKNEDAPSRQLFQGLFSATFSKHPYGRPVIGYVRTLKAATVNKLEAFYRRQYVSGNMGLILVGPLTEARQKSIVRLLEKNFGKAVHPKKAAPVGKRPLEPELRKAPVLEVKRFDVKTPTLAISFRVPELKHDDVPAIDLMSGILGMGELSRLYQRLFYKDALATEASGGLYVPYDPGMLYFQAELAKHEQILPAARALFEELQKLRDEGPTSEELGRVLVNSESERLYATQTADGLAGRIGFLQFIMGNLDFDEDYLRQIRDVDARKIQEVAARYLDPARMSATLLLPKDAPEFDLSQVTVLARQILGPGAALEPPKARRARVPAGRRESEAPEFFKLSSGIQVIYRERPQSHVMSLQACALGGLRLELAQPVESPAKDWGSSHLMALTWNKGTGTRDAREIARIVEGSAAGMDGFAGRNTVGLSMTGLARDWSKLSDLFSETLVDPRFPEAEVEHSRRVAEDSIRGVEDHSSQLCSKLFLGSLYERHPYGHLTLGSMESISAIHAEKLRKFHRDWIRPDRLVLSAVGNIKRPDLDRWLESLESRFGSQAGTGRRELPSRLDEEPVLKAPRWVERKLGREQTHIIVGGLGTRILDKDRGALQVLNTLLGGQSGRLFIELREKKSLAYTVAPLHFDGIERGYVGTYIACAPQKREEAISGIRAVLERLAAKGPTAREMERAKEFHLGRRAMDLQSDSSLASHYGLEAVYGIPYEDTAAVIRRISAIRAKDVQDVCRRYLVEPAMVTSVVG